jgi:uncharacterized damage-inducible protein DinB
LVTPVLHSFQQVREDLEQYASGLAPRDVWCNVDGASIGFHLKHMAGSVERLTAYLTGVPLTSGQLEAAQWENEGEEGADTLIALLHSALSESEQQLRAIQPQSLYDGRVVGRKALPTNVLGLLVHLAEHTQRHLGQVITLTKLVRQSP